MITAQQQAVADIAAEGPLGFENRVMAHAARLDEAGDVAALKEFTEALVLFSKVCRQVSEEKAAASQVTP